MLWKDLSASSRPLSEKTYWHPVLPPLFDQECPASVCLLARTLVSSSCACNVAALHQALLHLVRHLGDQPQTFRTIARLLTLKGTLLSGSSRDRRQHTSSVVVKDGEEDSTTGPDSPNRTIRATDVYKKYQQLYAASQAGDKDEAETDSELAAVPTTSAASARQRSTAQHLHSAVTASLTLTASPKPDFAVDRLTRMRNTQPKLSVTMQAQWSTAAGHLSSAAPMATTETLQCYGREFGAVVDSYRHLFCRRCFMYDCTRHGTYHPLPRDRDELEHQNQGMRWATWITETTSVPPAPLTAEACLEQSQRLLGRRERLSSLAQDETVQAGMRDCSRWKAAEVRLVCKLASVFGPRADIISTIVRTRPLALMETVLQALPLPPNAGADYQSLLQANATAFVGTAADGEGSDADSEGDDNRSVAGSVATLTSSIQAPRRVPFANKRRSKSSAAKRAQNDTIRRKIVSAIAKRKSEEGDKVSPSQSVPTLLRAVVV